MKNLKFILGFLVFAGLTSCSSDDDANAPAEVDRIVGKWKIQELLVDGEVVLLTDCEKQTTVEFKTNGDIISSDFYDDFETEECIEETSTEKWENRGNNIYRITDGATSEDVNIVFSNNNNTFKVSQEDEEGSYSTTFVRI